MPVWRSNEEYMSLLREMYGCRTRDSIVNAVAVLREHRAEIPVQRQLIRREICSSKAGSSGFTTPESRLIGHIHSIEQVGAGQSGRCGFRSGPCCTRRCRGFPDSLKVRNLVDNLYFREHLAETDYAALCEYQHLENPG